jgi:undecaprenyl-diphosphatase
MPDDAAKKSAEKIKEAAQRAAQAETSPAPVQGYRTALFWFALVSAMIIFSILAFLAVTTPFFPIDLQITRAIQSIDAPLFEGSMRLISWPGFLPQSVIITLLTGFTLYMYGLHWEALSALFTAFISGVANELAKSIIQRPRPGGDLVDVFEVLMSYSFPSGHVMFYVSLFGFLWYVTYVLLKRSWKRTLLLISFGALILLVGVSRIYLGQHWASDVLGAYLLGGLILAGTILLYQWGKPRFFVHQPAAQPNSIKE